MAVEVAIDVDVVPVASHFVMGVLQVVVQDGVSALLILQPFTDVVVAVEHATLQSLTVLREQEDDDDDDSEFEIEADGPGFSGGTISLRASTQGSNSACNKSSTVLISFLRMLDLTLLVVPMTHVTREKAVLKMPPINPLL